jgi:branched-chain amino acid transport system ATP-binding protein
VLDINNVTVKFGGLVAVSRLSFRVGEGEICAVIGPNGAGKTSLFNAITGFAPLEHGCISFNGRQLGGLAPHQIAAHGICRTFQNNGIIAEMTVLENVITGLELTTASSFAGAILGLPASRRAEREATAKAKSMLAAMGLDSAASRIAGDLPSGQQRLVEIARALVSGARLLLLDEPASGLFETERQMLCDEIRRVAGSGVSVLLIEHVQDVVRVADRVIVMNQGAKIAECAPAELNRHKAVLEAYLGHV